ncbi:MAG: triose-phosphate isomerase [Proteobacteria bacterium]|nr:triose-phosphate isomerase [Pseudomonadota bacterium]
MARKPVIAGNWKMNTTPDEGVQLVEGLKKRLSGINDVEIIVAPPFTHLSRVGEVVEKSNIKLSSQDMSPKDSGAYTGEVSPLMIKAVGCQYVIIGHSERRLYFGETDESVEEKVTAALNHGITPIICIGESLAEREADQTLNVILTQLKGGLSCLTAKNLKDIIIAYEPVWAIGTGKTATDEQAQDVHHFIRKTLAGLFGEEISGQTRILYGGSVKPDNVSGLMTQPDIDGALVGGASLSVESFEKIVKFNRS